MKNYSLFPTKVLAQIKLQSRDGPWQHHFDQWRVEYKVILSNFRKMELSTKIYSRFKQNIKDNQSFDNWKTKSLATCLHSLYFGSNKIRNT